MTYLQLAGWFLAGAALLAIVLTLVSRRRARPAAMLVTVLVMLALTAVFDTAMIASGLFHYSPAHLLGVHIGLAPLEDFAYPLAGAVLLPVVWATARSRRRARPEDEESGA